MKNPAISFLAFVFLFPLCSFDKGGLLDKPMPVLPNKTLDGKTIDEQYFRGHITIVTFMYIGCPPCMNEISVLNKLKNQYAGNERVQILCVARQMPSQMVQFNSSDSSMFSRIRRAFKVDPIQYAIQPACNEGDSKMEQKGEDVSIHSECSTIENTYGVSGYPATFYVDARGIIREIHQGGPGKRDDEQFYKEMKEKIDSLLAKQ